MTIARDQARELLAFYREAGVDALLEETPTDRFAGDEAAPRAEPARARAEAPTSAAARALPARAPDGGDRARPPLGLYRQRRAVAAAGQSHADAAGIRGLPAFHVAPDRTRRSRHISVPRHAFGADAAQQQRRHPQDPRALVSIPHRHARDPRDRNPASRLSPASAAAEAVCLAGFSVHQEGAGELAVYPHPAMGGAAWQRRSSTATGPTHPTCGCRMRRRSR